MLSDYEFQQMRTEAIIVNRLIEQQDAEAWADYMRRERNERLSEAMEGLRELEYSTQVSSRSAEREDMELAARLRQLADDIERRYL